MARITSKDSPIKGDSSSPLRSLRMTAVVFKRNVMLSPPKHLQPLDQVESNGEEAADLSILYMIVPAQIYRSQRCRLMQQPTRQAFSVDVG